MVQWSGLDYNLLVEIAGRIKLYEDFVRFGGVCCSWRAAAVKDNFRYAFAQIPWLMLPKTTRDSNHLRSFFNISTGKIRQVFLPEANGKRYFSSKGWLITIAPDLSMTLLHPFSRTQIKLPNMKTFENMYDLSTGPSNMLNFIEKCVLSADPLLTSNYTLMVIHGDLRKLAYYEPTNKVWTTIELWQWKYDDICYYRDKFYAVNCRGKIMACDFEKGNPATATVVATLSDGLLRNINVRKRLYIVESGGSLLVVARRVKSQQNKSRSKRTYQTCDFQIFEVDLDTNTWTEVNNLGNRALFLGNNSSFSLEASDCFGSKPNCIYFTDDNFESYYFSNNRYGGGKDMGIYNLQSGSFCPQFWGNLCCRINPPIWI